MKKAQFEFGLPVSILKEGNSFIAYTPALDLSTVGDTLEQAQERFTEAVQLFFEELAEKGTINEALTELGWQKADDNITPPVVVSHQTETFSVPQFAL